MNVIHSLLRRADTRGSADIIYCMWRISQLCVSGIANDVTNGVMHRIFNNNGL